ncbi:MAG TPA: hypothetical protein VIO32_07605, partial [Candidatus Baltobacteraceae bacterium]
GVRCTVNSDDPGMFETDINREYLTLAGQRFAEDELRQLAIATLESTFLSDADKRALRTQWLAASTSH